MLAGCIHSTPSPALLTKCLLPQPETPTGLSSFFATPPPTTPKGKTSSTVRFIGDSTVRQVYFAASQLMDPTLPGTPEAAGGEKHGDKEVRVVGKNGGEVVFSFWWQVSRDKSSVCKLGRSG